MKNSVQSLTRETWGGGGGWWEGGRKGEGTGDMRGRWGMSERGEEDKGGGVEVEER